MGLIHDIPTCAQLMERIVKEAMGVLSGLSQCVMKEEPRSRL